MKRYIASDIHDGNTYSDYDRIMGFLDLVDDDADELLILGDFLELSFSNINIITKVEPYSSLLEKVKAIAVRKPVKYILGNHDWYSGVFASLIEPIEIVPRFSENGTYYCHGHETSWYNFTIGTPFDPAYWRKMFPFVLPPVAFMWVVNKWLGIYDDTYSWAVALLHEGAATYARKNGYHTLVFGHTHCPCVETRGGVNLYNSGDMLDSYSYLVQENGKIELKYF